MSRLTERKDEWAYIPVMKGNERQIDKFNDVLHALGKYEDTGLTYQQVADLQAENTRLRAERDEIESDMKELCAGESIMCSSCKHAFTSDCNAESGGEFCELWDWNGLEAQNEQQQ